MASSFLLVIAGFPVAQAIYEMTVLHEKPYALGLFRQKPTKASLHAWDQASKDRSIFGKAIRPVVLQCQYDAFGDLGAKALRGHGDWLFYRPDADYLLLPSWNHIRFYRETYDTLVDGKWINPRNPLIAVLRLRDQLAARGIVLLMVPIPGKADIYPELLGSGFDSHPQSPTAGFIEELRRNNIPVVDLFSALLEAKAEGNEPLYLRRDTHWTPFGMEIAASTIFKTLKQNPAWIAIPDSLHRDYGIHAMEIDRFGDIAEMTKLPHRQKNFATEKVTAEQVWDPLTNTPYRDDPASPILLLGDSFSRIYQTDGPRSAGLIAHIAHKLGCPLTSIVNDGGASTVVRQQLSRRPELLRGKKIVIWAFVERDIRFGEKGWQILDLPFDSPTAPDR